MTIIQLACASIRIRLFQSILCVLSIALAMTLLSCAHLLYDGINQGFSRNARHIDMVVGAKGSPLQLVLSSIYHADVPNGNIHDGDALAHLQKHPHIRKAIPMTMGDNYRGYRLVGTTTDYIDIYNGQLESGSLFSKNNDVVAGAATSVKIGDHFSPTHGFSANGHDIHKAQHFVVTGKLKPTGTILDQLLITPLSSIENMHHPHHDENEDEDEDTHDAGEEHEGHDHENHHDLDDHHDHSNAKESSDNKGSPAITAILVQVRSPINLMNLPRQINQDPHLTAAVPSYEISRLSQNFGFSKQLAYGIGLTLVFLSASLLFTLLGSNFATRRYDLALIRALGAPSTALIGMIVIESMILCLCGAGLGIFSGHALAYFTVISNDKINMLITPMSTLSPSIADVYILLIGVFSGLIASAAPIMAAARINTADLLALGR